MNSALENNISLMAQWFEETRICVGSLSSAKEISAALDKAPDDLRAQASAPEYKELGVCNGRNSLLMFSHANRFEEPDARLMDMADPATPSELYAWMTGFMEGYTAVKQEQERGAMVA